MRRHCAARQLGHNEDGSIPISPEIDMDERRFSELALLIQFERDWPIAANPNSYIALMRKVPSVRQSLCRNRSEVVRGKIMVQL